MIVDKIQKYLSENDLRIDEALRYEVEKISGAAFKRQFMDSEEKDSKGKLWFSQIGRCVRQLAYAYHGFEKDGKEIDSRAKIIFWTGDLMELVVTMLAKLAGCNLTATGLHQMRIELKVNGSIISGRPDGIFFENKELYLVEVKSMSDYGFQKFEKGEIDEAYLAQVNVEMETLGISKCVFIGLNKNTGILHEAILEKRPEIVEKARKNVLSVVHSTPETLPERPYKPDEKGIYPAFPCMYCAYYNHCLVNSGLAEKVIVRNAYRLKEKTDGGNKLQGKDVKSGADDSKEGKRVRSGAGNKLATPRAS